MATMTTINYEMDTSTQKNELANTVLAM